MPRSYIVRISISDSLFTHFASYAAVSNPGAHSHQWVAVTRGHMAVRDRHAMINQCVCHLSCKAKL